jgi:L-lactate dehydrogenase (cytochrome)
VAVPVGGNCKNNVRDGYVRPLHPRALAVPGTASAIRTGWQGKLALKGVLASGDAEMAARLGADGVIVFNHGGRQLDAAMPSLAALPDVRVASGGMAVMLDSGVRRGTDVLKAMALGAASVFVGRPFLYAAAIGGKRGVRHAISLLSLEIDRNMAMLGCTRLDDVGPSRGMTR